MSPEQTAFLRRKLPAFCRREASAVSIIRTEENPLPGTKTSEASLYATRTTLLERVRDFSDTQGWLEFDALYRPILVRYAQARDVNAVTADEIAQQCLVAIVQQIRCFNRTRSFRGWLRAMVNHKVCDYFAQQRRDAKGAARSVVTESTARDPVELWQREWNAGLLRKLIESLRGAFAEHTIRAFQLYVLDERPVEEICTTLGLTANQIYVAKNRVTRHLKEKCAAWVSELYGITT